jgi:tetratricopeptide (TPR) repeat protein
MKPSNELFDLIKSLSKSEKRFFKLSSSLQSGEKNYLKIFDFIDKQGEYNEDELKETFKKERFINHLPSEKNHLYKLILKSLRGFHSDNSINSVLKEEIKNVEILYKKSLYKECRKFLMRAKKTAEEHEKFYYWFELISWEKLLIEEDYEQGNFSFDLDKLIQEELSVIEKLRNLAEYQMIYSRINYIFRSGGFVTRPDDIAAVDEISNHHLIIGKNTALSSSAASICYYIQGLCNATKRDFETALVKFNRTKEIIDRQPKLKQDLAKRYVRTQHNLILAHISMGNYEEASLLTTELEKLQGAKGFNTYDVKVKIFTCIYTSRITISYRKGDFHSTLKIVEEMIEGLESYGDRLPKEQVILFSYHIAYVFFGAGLYKDSLKWVNTILNDNEQNLRQDIYSYTRIFNLILHYELGNYDLLEYLMKSTTRQIKKNSKTELVELSILKFLKKVIRLGDKARVKGFETFQAELDETLALENQSAILEYFNIKAWVQSKIENESFEDTIKVLYRA